MRFDSTTTLTRIPGFPEDRIEIRTRTGNQVRGSRVVLTRKMLGTAVAWMDDPASVKIGSAVCLPQWSA